MNSNNTFTTVCKVLQSNRTKEYPRSATPEKAACGNTQPRFLGCKKHERLQQRPQSTFRQIVSKRRDAPETLPRRANDVAGSRRRTRCCQQHHPNVDGKTRHRETNRARKAVSRHATNEKRRLRTVVQRLRRQAKHLPRSSTRCDRTRCRPTRGILGRRVQHPSQERDRVGQPSVESGFRHIARASNNRERQRRRKSGLSGEFTRIYDPVATDLQGFYLAVLQTCKVFRPIVRRLSNSTRRTQVRTDDKGLYLSGLRCGATGLYTTGSSSEAIFCLPARLAGRGEACHLQGNGGASA